MKHYRIILFVAIVVALAACRSFKQTVSNRNLAFMYKKESNQVHPQFAVYHPSDSVTELHFKVASKELLYAKAAGENDFMARVLVHCHLTSSYDTPTVIDTVSLLVNDINNLQESKALVGVIKLKADQAVNYLLEVAVSDLNKNQNATFYIDIDKSTRFGAQNFMVTAGEVPLFRNYLGADELFAAKYRSSQVDKYYVRYFKREFPLALPPFSVIASRPFNYRADSIFTMPVDQGGTVQGQLAQKGFYHFQADSSKKDGLTLYRYYEGFPEIRTADQLVQPLRYISSKEEFEQMEKATNKKAAVDNFWLKCAGSPERAKDIIRKFYNRVQDANVYFTSYLEGWKSDRGMVYIIYGPPNVIYKTTSTENWVYGEDNNLLSITYSFNRLTNPFTSNDYQLDRSNIYKDSWYKAVDIWRQGRVYLDN